MNQSAVVFEILKTDDNMLLILINADPRQNIRKIVLNILYETFDKVQ